MTQKIPAGETGIGITVNGANIKVINSLIKRRKGSKEGRERSKESDSDNNDDSGGGAGGDNDTDLF